jgi:hypothetical protein
MGMVENSQRLASLEAENVDLRTRLERLEGGLPVIHRTSRPKYDADLNRLTLVETQERKIFNPDLAVVPRNEYAALQSKIDASENTMMSAMTVAVALRETLYRTVMELDQLRQATAFVCEQVGITMTLSAEGRIVLDVREGTPADTIRLSGDLVELGEGLKLKLRQSAGHAARNSADARPTTRLTKAIRRSVAEGRMMERNDRVATTVEDLRREVAELKARADSERAVLRTIFARLDREDTKARTAINALLTQRDELHDVADVVLDAVEVLRLQVSRLQSQIDLLVGVNRVH